MERTQCQHLGQNVAEDIEAALSILFHLADLLDRLLHALSYLFFDVPDIILNGQQVRRLAGNGPARLQNRRSAEGYFVLASTWYDFLRDNKNVLEDFMWHADEAETSMALSLYGDLVHMDLAIDGGGTPLVDPKWKMAPGEASHRWQFYGAEGTFALLEKDDLDYGVIGNPTKATKEKGDKLVEAVVEGYSELIKELLETHPVGKNPLGFRNPLATTASTAAPIPPSTRTTTRRADPPTTRSNSSIQNRQKDFPFFCLLWLSEDARFQVCSADSPLFSQRDV